MALFDRASIPGFCTVGRSNPGVVERGGAEKRSPSILPPLEFLSLSAIELEDRPAPHRLFQPIEELSGRVDLVVMLALGEDRHLVEVLGEPGRCFGEGDETVLDDRRLRMEPHDLLAFRFIAGGSVEPVGDQFLDKLSTGSLVLDQHDVGIEEGFAARAPRVSTPGIRAAGAAHHPINKSSFL
jgi:hypothetical protein